ncbi:MAG: hypothetical protein JSS99_02530 [Actinobacteria bacterium]|nr:hypothetical protein [Actinomycetota bacterium]
MSVRRVAGAVLVLLALTASPACAGAGATYRDDGAVRAALQQVPGVKAALAAGQPRRAAVLVNRWLAPQIPAAATGADVLPTYGRSAHELLDAFAARSGGVFCDGAADTLVAALGLLGVEAFRFDFGHVADGLTHTTVVVPSGGRYWIVDPTFVLDLNGADGHPLDLVAAWQATADGIRNAVTLRTGDLSARAEVGVDDPRAVCADAPARWTMCALGTYLQAFGPALQQAGYPTGERGLLLLSLRGDLFSPGTYGVPAELLAQRAAVAPEPRPVRVTATRRAGASVTVGVRDLRAYATSAIVTLRDGAVVRRRAVVVPASGTASVTFPSARRPGRLRASVALARYDG